MKPRSQNEIVSQFLESVNDETEFTEEVAIPGLKNWFEPPPINSSEKTAQFRTPQVKKLGTKPRAEIAEVLLGLLNFKPGITGFKWVVGEPSIEVYYVDKFEQNKPQDEEQEEKLRNLFVMILKTRRSILAIEWKFGSEYLEITSRAH